MHLWTARLVFLLPHGREGMTAPWGHHGSPQAEGWQAYVWRNRSVPACDGPPGNNTTFQKGNRVRRFPFSQLMVIANPERFGLQKGRGEQAGQAWGAWPDLLFVGEQILVSVHELLSFSKHDHWATLKHATVQGTTESRHLSLVIYFMSN